MKDTQKVREDLAGKEVSVGIFFIGAVETNSYNLRGSLDAIWTLGSAPCWCQGFSYLLIHSRCW